MTLKTALTQTLPFLMKENKLLPTTTSDRRNMHQLGDHLYAVGRIHNRRLSTEEKVAIANCIGRNTPIGITVPAIGRLMKDHTLYHSLLHNRGAAQNNCVCMFQTADEQGFAIIDYFCLLSSTQPMAMLKVYECTTESILKSIRPPRTQELELLNNAEILSNYIIQVKKLSQASTMKAVSLSAIKKKCVLVPQKGQPVDYLAIIPNPYEHH